MGSFDTYTYEEAILDFHLTAEEINDAVGRNLRANVVQITDTDSPRLELQLEVRGIQKLGFRESLSLVESLKEIIGIDSISISAKDSPNCLGLVAARTDIGNLLTEDKITSLDDILARIQEKSGEIKQRIQEAIPPSPSLTNRAVAGIRDFWNTMTERVDLDLDAEQGMRI